MRNCMIFLALLATVAFAAGAVTVSADSDPAQPVGTVALPVGGYSPLVSGDGAGYMFWDSTEASEWAPSYSWHYPTNPQGWAGDDTYWTTSLPFKVVFCGTTYNSGGNLYVGSNGMIGFSNSNMDEPINQNIPVSASPNALIAVLWDNLDGYSNGDIWVDTIGNAPNRAIFITYSPWYYDLAPSDPIEFQAVIYETSVNGINNTVAFRYKDVVGDSWRDNGFSATVGLENNSGGSAAKYSYNQEVIQNQFAIKFVDTDFVNSQIGAFSLLTPVNGYDGEVSEEIVFSWEAPSYSGDGTVTYKLFIADNQDFNDPEVIDTGTNTSYSYWFGTGDRGTYWWKVLATESYLGLTKWSQDTFRLNIWDVDVTETTWGAIKGTFE